MARHGRGASSTARAARRSGRGRATTTAASPTSCWPCAGDIPTLETVAAAWLAAPARARAAGARRQRRRPDDALPADRPPARHGRRGASSSCSPPTSPWSSPSTATSARSTSSSTAGPTPSASTCAASTSRARPRRPFDMVVLNGMSRYHLCLEALRRAPREGGATAGARRAVQRHAGAPPAATSASTSRTCPRCATGCGASPEDPLPERRILVAEARALRSRRGETRLLAAAVERIGAPQGRLSGARRRRPHARRRRRLVRRRPRRRRRRARRARAGRARAAGAVGHRIVHGGPDHTGPERVDAAAASPRCGASFRFAPLHLPAELDAIDAVATRFPDVPQVACFDTAFHRRMPEVAQRFAAAAPPVGPRDPPLRLSRPVVRVRRVRDRRRPARTRGDRPPRQRRQPGRRPRRHLRRHDDGPHARPAAS